MKTKISMKTIYLILVITIGLVGLGIGSTLAVFTASAEISNPISFSSNLSYNGDIFDTVEVTIGPNATRTTNVSIFNDEQIDGVKYAVWYIYEGNSNDISFVRNQESDIDPSGTDIGQGGTLSMDIKNNTSNTITITIGVTTSKEDIVLPSYMKVITLATVAKYNLTLNKGTGVSIIYYKVNGASSSTTTNKTLSVNSGTTYYYYGVPQTGYTMNSCTSSSPCSGTMTSSVTKTLTASANSYNLTLSKGTGVSTIYYRVNGATNYSSSTASKTVAVKYGTTYYYYGTASTGYTMSSCTLSSPCSGTMGAGAVTKSLTATANSYNLTLNKGTGVSTIYYKVNGASSSTTTNKTLSVNSGTTYYYYGVPQTGYTMNSCTSSSPCSGTMTSSVTKTLTASANSYNLTLSKGTGVSTIYYRVNGATNYSSSTASKTVAVKYGTTYYYYGTASTGYTMSSCTLSSPCSGTMGAGAVTKSLTATANSYNLTLNKGTGVSTIYYKVNGASSYTSSTSNKTLSVKYGTTYYYYGTASTGYTMNSCTSSSPCSGTMGTSAVTKTLTAKSSGGSGPFTVTLYVDDTLYDTASVSGGNKYEKYFTAPTSSMTCTCTNGQTCSISHSSGVRYIVTINSVSANTTCRVEY